MHVEGIIFHIHKELGRLCIHTVIHQLSYGPKDPLVRRAVAVQVLGMSGAVPDLLWYCFIFIHHVLVVILTTNVENSMRNIKL